MRPRLCGSLAGDESEEGGHGWPTVYGLPVPSGKTMGWASGAASELAGV